MNLLWSRGMGNTSCNSDGDTITGACPRKPDVAVRACIPHCHNHRADPSRRGIISAGDERTACILTVKLHRQSHVALAGEFLINPG